MNKNEEHMPLPIRLNQRPPVPKYGTLRKTHETSQVDAPWTWGAKTWGGLLSFVVVLLLVVVVLLRRLLLDKVVLLRRLLCLVLLCLIRRPAPPPPPPPPPQPTTHHICLKPAIKSKQISTYKKMYLKTGAK
jgi:hypothetical protein